MTQKKYPSQLAERFQIRLPDGLRDQIRELAASNNRSMNAQIVFMLQFAIEELEMTAAVYGKGEKPRKTETLRDEVRRAKHILEAILADYGPAMDEDDDNKKGQGEKSEAPALGDEDDARIARKNKP